MASSARLSELAAALRRASHPPLRDWRFWAIQGTVVLLAALHLLVDLHTSVEAGAFPGGVPVALLIVPVGYAALRFGLGASAATGLWATVLWLPDLLLPLKEGHAPSDVIELALVVAVAVVFGEHIEVERLAHARVEAATAERLTAEAGYRQLFEANAAPTMVLDDRGVVTRANPAAHALFGEKVRGASAHDLLGAKGPVAALAGHSVTVGDGRDYRIDVAALPAANSGAVAQLVLVDVTDERSESRRATRYAALLVAAEEEQRRRLARELHDDPLQLVVHLARRLEQLETTADAPGLAGVRALALEAAVRLRALARDLRPPTLDQLGLLAALSSFLADVEEESGIAAGLEVAGVEARLSPEVELAAFRIVQEAVHNTIRHARAQKVDVAVAFDPAAVVLAVGDDGCGFRSGELEEREGPGSGHLGLLGMVERATLVGGHLDVESAPGSGTLVRATLPVGPRGASSNRSGVRATPVGGGVCAPSASSPAGRVPSGTRS
jgi:signal transduction histidine kinase